MSDVTSVATIIFDTIQQQRALHPDRPVLIGVAGAQGSGKTTACKLLEMSNRPRFAHFSLDDVYWSKEERADLARLIQTDAISARSATIAAYALCGFANFGSLAILLGGIDGVAPERRAEAAALGLRSIVAGTLTTCITGCLAGLFV